MLESDRSVHSEAVRKIRGRNDCLFYLLLIGAVLNAPEPGSAARALHDALAAS